MEIKQKVSENKGSFYADAENKIAAEMSYSLEDSLMVIEHTFVAPELRGRNMGLQLLNNAISFATEKGIKIKAVCPFVKSVFTKHPEKYKDIIHN